MGVKFANSAYATLASSITSSATSITLTTGQGARFPSLSGGDYFYATLIDTSNNLEIVKCTARSTDVLTVVRGQESTTARAYSAGDRIELRITAQGLLDLFSPALLAANNLSDLASAATARTNLGLAAIAASGSASDLGSGTVPIARFPTGTILQVVTATFDHSSYSTSAGTWYDITNATLTITPKSSSSKILLSGSFFGTGTANYSSQLRYLRNGSTFSLPSDGSRRPGHGGEEFTASDASYGLDLMAIDTPGTTSAVTYKAQFSTEGSGTHRFGTASNSYADSGDAGYPGTFRQVLVAYEIAN
jgi:hypothetical protein